MNEIKINNFKFLKFNCENINIIFSTAEDSLDFNKNSEEGRKNLKFLNQWFNLKEVGYLNQTHSSDVIIYNRKIENGDALITKEKDIGIGVFTADCVPILLVDTKNKVIAAVHSGWRGTVQNIVGKTIEKMNKIYNSKGEDIKVYIGPHNRSCCYEVGNEVIEKFKSTSQFTEKIIINNKINLEEYIINCLIEKHVKVNNIIKLNFCTYCSKDIKFHSYRKEKETYGRMFSFIYIK